MWIVPALPLEVGRDDAEQQHDSYKNSFFAPGGGHRSLHFDVRYHTRSGFKPERNAQGLKPNNLLHTTAGMNACSHARDSQHSR